MLQLCWSYITDIAYGGVDPRLPGNGGPECVDFLSPRQRFLETLSYITFAFVLFLRTLSKCTIKDTFPLYREGTGVGRRVLLILMCLALGIEIGFKVVTRQVIYILNPCHVLSMVQLPCEVEIYWVQHLLILVIVPFFLISCQGPYFMEDLLDFSWATLTFTLYAFYMFLVLQPIGMLSQVNLNSMICPAVSDPFNGPYYRIIACMYIPALIFLVGKGICIAGTVMLDVLYKDKKE
ncbi:hypothetical protein QZH41_012792 [Actinostola sp. cb2023]|nr:hypothetical protein QZH41_012792 [Actinostola sp. cb2023]